ncbi:hypothetical protein H8356DRAFT_1722831 [Neocallimastix lanati (nom. inval.)]|nr:hypothetical protein H8356DRAFT_1722831 [Neocallimastix sp. JGI-2020a]
MNFFLNLFIQFILNITFYFTLLFKILLCSKWKNNIYFIINTYILIIKYMLINSKLLTLKKFFLANESLARHNIMFKKILNYDKN